MKCWNKFITVNYKGFHLKQVAPFTFAEFAVLFNITFTRIFMALKHSPHLLLVTFNWLNYIMGIFWASFTGFNPIKSLSKGFNPINGVLLVITRISHTEGISAVTLIGFSN